MLYLIEYTNIDLVVCVHALQKIRKRVLDIVLMCQLQDRFVHYLAKPYYSLADKLVAPLLWRCHKPRLLDTRKFLCRSLINNDLDIGMVLQRCYRIFFGNLAFDKVICNLCLVLTPHHKHNLLSTHDCLHTHSDGTLRNLVRVREKLVLILARIVAQAHKACGRVSVAARFVESYLSKLAYSHDHEIDTAVHELFILFAILIDISGRHCSVREMYVCWIYVNIFQEILVHAMVTALWRFRCHRIELIKAIDNNIGKAHCASLVTVNEFGIKTEWSTAGRKAKHKRFVTFVFLYSIHHYVSNHINTLLFGRAYLGRNFLKLADTLY